MTTYTDRVQRRSSEILEPGELVLAAVPVMDTRLFGAVICAGAVGGATGRPWLGALLILIAFTVLRRRDRATGLAVHAAMVIAVTQHRVIALRATAWNGPRAVVWTIEKSRGTLELASRGGMTTLAVVTGLGRLSFMVPFVQRRRASLVAGRD